MVEMTRPVWFLPPLLLVTSAAAQGLPPHYSVGTAQRGRLAGGGEELPLRGDGYHFETNRGNPRAHYGTPALVGALERASAEVARAHPGSDLAIHDLAFQNGGAIRGHGSHRSGRDVDVAYYALEPDGAPMNPTRSIWFLSHGRARGVEAATAPRIDRARTWLWLRTLLTDDAIEVQYVFMAPALQRLILAHAGDDPTSEVAARVVRTPRGRRVDPHADHFHVRIHCSSADLEHGCVERRR